MTRRRWIADEVDFGKRSAALTGEHAEHLIRVLRVRVGQEFDVVVGSDPPEIRHARVAKIENARVEFALEEQVPSPHTSPGITLLLSIFKFDRMEWAIEKAVELGVSTIVPVIATRTQKHLATAATKRVERWRRIAQQAAEQSRREEIPEVSLPVTLKRAIETAKAGIVLAESEAELSLRECLEAGPAQEALALAIGPEGGWMSEELRYFADAGWQKASLGPNILRAETAAIAALSIVMSELQPS
jgi:16S rRNA (uracil1498-N3)-methyltransferase